MVREVTVLREVTVVMEVVREVTVGVRKVIVVTRLLAVAVREVNTMLRVIIVVLEDETEAAEVRCGGRLCVILPLSLHVMCCLSSLPMCCCLFREGSGWRRGGRESCSGCERKECL